jgi:integrase
LKNARIGRDKARLLLAEGVDPGQKRREVTQGFVMDDTNTFSVLAKEWWNHAKGTWSEAHAKKVWLRLEKNSFSMMDKTPIGKIKPKDIIFVIREIEKRDALDVTNRVLRDISRVFRYAVQMDVLIANPASELTDVLKPRKTQHRASMNTHELGGFLQELKSYHEKGRLLTQLALQLLVYTFVRPGG